MAIIDRSGDPRRGTFGPAREDLASQIQVYIERKACGRIRDLRVICADEQIILQGHSRTYHAKQLAQEAALDIAGCQPTLANQIVVS